MMVNKTQLSKDRRLLLNYFITENYDFLDYLIGEIIASNNSERMSLVLDTFKDERNNPILSSCLTTIEKRLEI